MTCPGGEGRDCKKRGLPNERQEEERGTGAAGPHGEVPPSAKREEGQRGGRVE